jgi:hypothetical protein
LYLRYFPKISDCSSVPICGRHPEISGFCIYDLLCVAVLVSVMVPGLRHRGLIQQYFGQAMTMVAGLLKKKDQEEEKKSN